MAALIIYLLLEYTLLTQHCIIVTMYYIIILVFAKNLRSKFNTWNNLQNVFLRCESQTIFSIQHNVEVRHNIYIHKYFVHLFRFAVEFFLFIFTIQHTEFVMHHESYSFKPTWKKAIFQVLPATTSAQMSLPRLSIIIWFMVHIAYTCVTA